MQWHKTRWALLGILPGVLVVYLLLFVMQRFELGGDFVEVFGHLVIFVATIISMFVLVTVHSDVDSVRIYLPIRIFRLPLATWKMVAIFLLYGILASSAVSLYTAFMAKTLLGLPISIGVPVAIAAAATAVVLAWSYAQQETTPEVTIVSGLLVAAGAIWIFQQQSILEAVRSVGIGTSAVIFALAVYVLAFLGFDWNRRARLPQLSARKSSQSMGMATDVKRRFKNAKEAQRWYEWRRYGWQLPASVIAVMFMYFFALPIFGTAFVAGQHSIENHNYERKSPLIVIDWASSVQFLTTGIQVAALVSAVVVGGFMFMKAGYWTNTSSFIFTQPLTTRKLAQARMFNIAKSTFAGLAILMLALSTMVLIVWARGDALGMINFLEQNYSLERWFVLAFFWGSTLAMMWTIVWPVNTGWVFLGVILTYGPAFAYVSVKQSSGNLNLDEINALNETAFRNAALPLAAIVGFGLIFMILSAIRSRQVDWTSVGAVLVGWAISVWGFYSYTNGYKPIPGESRIGPNQFELYPVNWPLWFALSLLIVAPPFTLSLLMHRSRHQ
jgi:hypothetical protein